MINTSGEQTIYHGKICTNWRLVVIYSEQDGKVTEDPAWSPQMVHEKTPVGISLGQISHLTSAVSLDSLLFVETKSNQMTPPNYSGTVKLLPTLANGQVYLTTHSSRDLPYLTYQLPGTAIEVAETFEVAAQRMLREQFDQSFTPTKHLATFSSGHEWETVLAAGIEPSSTWPHTLSHSLFDKQGVALLMQRGLITDAVTCAALHHWLDPSWVIDPSPTDIQFICTGNYYRSRLSEIYVRYRSAGEIVTDSRGLGAHRKSNPGMISKYACEYLEGIAVPLGPPRFPEQLLEGHLIHAKQIIVLDEDEHRPMMEKQFPEWVDRVTYWKIPDVQFVAHTVALPALHRKLDELLAEQGYALPH